MSNVMEFGQPIRVGNASADPSTGFPGEIYYNTSSSQVKYYNGSSWSVVGSVSSVNGQSGAVTLTTDNISEGTSNLYFTAARAQTAVVVNAYGTYPTNQAPSIAFFYSTITNYATLASPALTGTPTAPTATAGTNTTQIATTAFVTTAVSNAFSGFANTNLSNLASTAVNVSIIPGADNLINLGSSSFRWASVYSKAVTAGSSALSLNGTSINVNSLNINNLASPVNSTDAANKTYTDTTALVKALIFG